MEQCRSVHLILKICLLWHKGENMANNNTYDASDASVIGNNLPPRAMRYTMENKNLLKRKGSLYVGTGKTKETTIRIQDPSSESGYSDVTYDIPTTEALTPPTTAGTYLLKCVVGTDNTISVMWVKENS